LSTEQVRSDATKLEARVRQRDRDLLVAATFGVLD